MLKEENWENAKDYLDLLLEEYKSLLGKPGVNPIFGMAILNALLVRFNSGERTQELFDEIMSCE